jgi:hypothetical protein
VIFSSILPLREVSMKKNKLFIFLSIITIVLIFGVAATCNFCGVPIEIGEIEETTSEVSVEESRVEQTQQESPEQAETAEEVAEPETETEPDSESEGGEIDVVEIIPREEIVLHLESSLSGHIIEEGVVYIETIVIGDNHADKQIKSYLSFPLEILWDADIVSARMGSSDFAFVGDIAEFGDIVIESCDYEENLEYEDFNISGTHIISLPAADTSNIVFSNGNLIDSVQEAVDNRKQFFQVKIEFSRPSDEDEDHDRIDIRAGDIYLRIEYY